MTRLTSFNFPSLAKDLNLPELTKTTYNFGSSADPAFTIPNIDSDFDVYEFTLEVDTTLTLTNFDNSASSIRYFTNTSDSTHDLIVPGVFTLEAGEVAATLYNNNAATLLWKTTAGSTTTTTTTTTTQSVEPTLLDDDDDGEEQPPGVYVVDTRTAAFSITLPSQKGEWIFHTPYSSIEDNVLTINAGEDQTFTDQTGSSQQDDLEINTQLTIVTIINTEGGDDFFVTVTDSKYKDATSTGTRFQIGSEVSTTETATATSGETLLVDVRTNSITVTPPSNPEENTTFGVVDAYNNARQNNITIDFVSANQNLHSISENVVLNVNKARMKFIYANTTIGWLIV